MSGVGVKIAVTQVQARLTRRTDCVMKGAHTHLLVAVTVGMHPGTEEEKEVETGIGAGDWRTGWDLHQLLRPPGGVHLQDLESLAEVLHLEIRIEAGEFFYACTVSSFRCFSVGISKLLQTYTDHDLGHKKQSTYEFIYML